MRTCFVACRHQLLASIALTLSKRGRINREGLIAATGVVRTAGLDKQALAIVDPRNLRVRVELPQSRCCLPAGLNHPNSVSEAAAIKSDLAGRNNRSGGAWLSWHVA